MFSDAKSTKNTYFSRCPISHSVTLLPLRDHANLLVALLVEAHPVLKRHELTLGETGLIEWDHVLRVHRHARKSDRSVLASQCAVGGARAVALYLRGCDK